MVRAVLFLAVSLTAFPLFATDASAQQSQARRDSLTRDDSFLYAAPASGGTRVPNYVADSAKGQPFDQNDRRRFERPYLSGEPFGLPLQPR
ncbi:hypothetical protein ACUSIJ_20865 [Pseudochelatococcus sp. B33]